MDQEIGENLLTSQIQNDNDIPALTEYKIVCNCCCCFQPCASIETENNKTRYFWGSHELDFCMNVFVSCLIVFVESIHFAFVFTALDDIVLKIVAEVLNAMFIILFLWSYFSAACMDPGFLPFNWVATKRYKYSWDELLAGLAIREDQYLFAERNRPPCSSFSKSAGRFVIRADHICGWIGNWVGKRNHKNFILMNLWGGVFALNLLLWHIPTFLNIFKQNFMFAIFVLFEATIELCFGLLLPYVFVCNLIDLRKDMTKIKKFKKEAGQKLKCMDAMREVFGNGSVCCWWLPISAFDDHMEIDPETELPGAEEVNE